MQVLQLTIEINYGQSLSNNSKPQIGENDYNKRVMVDPKKRLRDLAEEGSYFKALCTPVLRVNCIMVARPTKSISQSPRINSTAAGPWNAPQSCYPNSMRHSQPSSQPENVSISTETPSFHFMLHPLFRSKCT